MPFCCDFGVLNGFCNWVFLAVTCVGDEIIGNTWLGTLLANKIDMTLDFRSTL